MSQSSISLPLSDLFHALPFLRLVAVSVSFHSAVSPQIHLRVTPLSVCTSFSRSLAVAYSELLRVFFFLSAQLRYFTLLSSLLCFSPLPSLSFPPPLFLFFFFFPAVSVSPGTVVIRNGSSLAENNKQHLFEVCDGCLTSPRCFMQILPPFVTGINKRLNLF